MTFEGGELGFQALAKLHDNRIVTPDGVFAYPGRS